LGKKFYARSNRAEGIFCRFANVVAPNAGMNEQIPDAVSGEEAIRVAKKKAAKKKR
jgi:hypothetical protein